MISQTSQSLISLPKGGGAVKGLGETFSPNLHTGTGNFTVPISVPSGRNGFQPSLSLMYSSGQGNGALGLGWDLSIPGISRKTSHGIPRYDASDIFILSGAEDLVPLETTVGEPKQFRPRTEGLFARIVQHDERGHVYWRVYSKDGIVSTYGTPSPVDVGPSWRDPAVVSGPGLSDTSLLRIFAWRLSETRDPFGNRVEYDYIVDGEQLYPKEIRYIDVPSLDDSAVDQFLVRILFHYEFLPTTPSEPRPDAFSNCRAGFEIRTGLRLQSITVTTLRPGQANDSDKYKAIRKYELNYQLAEGNGVSLLNRIRVSGYLDDEVQSLPDLEFTYSNFHPEQNNRRRLIPVNGPGFPGVSLVSPDLQMADLFGDGLPDVFEMSGASVGYWRNRGEGQFDLPQVMREAPAGIRLSDPGVQLLDADGDGRLDLMVHGRGLSGYFPLEFTGLWDRRSFRHQRIAPSFDLKGSDVRLLDLDGDGVTDAMRSATQTEFYFNDPAHGWSTSRVVPRGDSTKFGDIAFTDPRMQIADMTGDGLSDLVLVHDGNISYKPNFGYGEFGDWRVMKNSPNLPFRFNPQRVLIGDVDGDGLADLLYVENDQVTLWINQSGNAWSDPIVITGTPAISDIDSVRLIDLRGSGVAGVLFTRNADGSGRPSWYFLDLTGGVKPYLLVKTNNNMGSVTTAEYRPSTEFYLEDQKSTATRWRTSLPFPVQVVSRVTVEDLIAQSTLKTVYRYHHGYWDGAEREFRGFGRVDVLDSETFREGARHADAPLRTRALVDKQQYSPPLETRTWFHLGPVGPEFGDWTECDLSHEFWPGDAPYLNSDDASIDDQNELIAETKQLFRRLNVGDPRVARDAVRAWRGSILRTELYAHDGTGRSNRPYTVTESAYGVRPEPSANSSDRIKPHVFYPFPIAKRVTQWERGTDPMTQLTFWGDHDVYGQARASVGVAVPRGAELGKGQVVSFLATRNTTRYAQRDDLVTESYMVDRVCRVESSELINSGNIRSAREFGFAALKTIPSGAAAERFGLEVSFYDGEPFEGLPVGQLGKHGFLSRVETLAFTEDQLQSAFAVPGGASSLPPYLSTSTPIVWPADYPAGFREYIERVPRAGYIHRTDDADFAAGYYVRSKQQKFDGQGVVTTVRSRGLVVAQRDALGNESTIAYDRFQFLPIETTDAANLVTRVEYDYRTFQPLSTTDPNENRSAVNYTPLGLVQSISILGKAGEAVGDTPAAPSVSFEYNLRPFDLSRNNPISVRSIRREHHASESDWEPAAEFNRTLISVEFSDGFGRVVQTRTQATNLSFGDPTFPDAGLPTESNVPPGKALGTNVADRVIVSGWQVYDNKGRVVEKYEPFFSTGFGFAAPTERELGQRVRMFYDPRGQLVKTVNPDDSEQKVMFGIPNELLDPLDYQPTPWVAYTYDANDNAERTHPGLTTVPPTHFNTPASIEIDALGRTVRSTVRNGSNRLTDWFHINTKYDIRGNPIAISDQLGRVAFQHQFDLLNRKLRIENFDAGIRRTMFDAGANPIEYRDSKGALILTAYDQLNRITRLWARDVEAESVTLRQRFEYGDEIDREEAKRRNLLRQLHRQFDEAGLLISEQFDFKGNLLESVRRVVNDEKLLAPLDGAATGATIQPFRMNWDESGTTLNSLISDLLEETEFRISFRFDALDRPWQMTYPKDVDDHRKILRRFFDEGGGIRRVEVDGKPFAQEIALNARGQRILLVLGNGLMTRWTYDSKTFRLTRQRTEKFKVMAGTQYEYSPDTGLIQDLFYAYDLVGNPIVIVDRTRGSGVRNNPDSALVLDPSLKAAVASGDVLRRRFEFDPIYQLRLATGRVDKSIAASRSWWDEHREGFNSGSHGPPNQGNATDLTSFYIETYDYDPAGNMLWLKSQTREGIFKRHFGMGGLRPADWNTAWQAHLNSNVAIGISGLWSNPPGNTLTHVGNDDPTTSQTHFFDACGNLVRELEDRRMEWDAFDRLRSFRIQLGNSMPSTYATYLYDSAGVRVKKLVRTGRENFESTVEIESVFDFNRQLKGGVRKENNRVRIPG